MNLNGLFGDFYLFILAVVSEVIVNDLSLDQIMLEMLKIKGL